MTVKEVIEKTASLRRNNQFTIEDKMRWLNECEAKIQLECLLLDSVEFIYDYTADADEELIAPMPYDELYVYYICSRIDESLGEEKAYNDSITRYNNAQYKYQKWLIRTVDPANNKVQLKRSAPVIYRGDKATITLYGLPVADKAETNFAAATYMQDMALGVSTEVELKENVLSFELSEAQTYSLKQGTLYVGYDIRTADGFRYKDDKVQRYYVDNIEGNYGEADAKGSIIDATLELSGKAADAAVTGAEFKKVNNRAGELERRTGNLEADTAETKAEVEELKETLDEHREYTSNNLGGLSGQIAVERERLNNLITNDAVDGELLDVRVGYEGTVHATAGEAVRTQFFSLAADAVNYSEDAELSSELRRWSNGHFWKIRADRQHVMSVYRGSDINNLEAYKKVVGSGYIKCPKYLCVNHKRLQDDSGANVFCYLYFYNLVNGEYVLNWDIINFTTSAASGYIKNYIRGETARSNFGRMVEVPDGVYMRFHCSSENDVELYGWDGVPFGMPVSGDMTFMKTDATAETFSDKGSGGVVFPGYAKMYICQTGTVIKHLCGVKDGKSTYLTEADTKYGALPEGYDYFRARLYTGYINAENFDKSTKTGDISEYISIVCNSYCAVRPTARAERVIERAKAICSYEWVPAKNLHSSSVSHAAKKYFKAGVTYNGLPYGSVWTYPNFIGWHVLPHTFINAVNDDASILFNKVLKEGETDAPYYSTVCSAFGCMAAGWPYPQNNYGFIVDPNIWTIRSPNPAIGELWSNGEDHCVVPERVEYFGDGTYAICAYESITPISMRTARFSNIATEDTLDAYQVETKRYVYYGIEAHHKYSTYKLNKLEAVDDKNPDIVPYANFNDRLIINGCARPYRGDKSVYTSEGEEVLINIKDANAVYLYLGYPDGGEKEITISKEKIEQMDSDGNVIAVRVDVFKYIYGSGIYTVHTDTDSTKESFEYVEVKPIEWWIKGSNELHFSRSDFWYANVVVTGNDIHSASASGVMIPCDLNNDYSDWAANCPEIRKVNAVFYKGTYGAYTVPLKEKT